MAVPGQALAVGDVEPHVIPLVRRGVLVAVQQDHEGHRPAQRHGHVGARRHRQRHLAALHGHRGVAGQHQPVVPVQDHLLGGDLDVGAAPRAVHHHSDGAEVGALLLVAARRRRSADELAVHRHPLRGGRGRLKNYNHGRQVTLVDMSEC